MTVSCRSKSTVSSRIARFCYGLLSAALSMAAVPLPQTAPSPAAAAAPVVVPSDYVIGSDDVLSVVFWRDKDLSGDVTVRPDGRISLPLVHVK